jgi:hypothetical protein
MGSHDVGLRAGWKFLAEVGNQLPGAQNCLLDGVGGLGLRWNVAGKTEKRDQDKKNSSLCLHCEYLLSVRTAECFPNYKSPRVFLFE